MTVLLSTVGSPSSLFPRPSPVSEVKALAAWLMSYLHSKNTLGHLPNVIWCLSPMDDWARRAGRLTHISGPGGPMVKQPPPSRHCFMALPG